MFSVCPREIVKLPKTKRQTEIYAVLVVWCGRLPQKHNRSTELVIYFLGGIFMIYPVITLYQPWATWIMREWKTIETRTHNKFACLEHKTILIHAGLRTDASAINNPYLTKEQLLYEPDEMINGFILGSAFVNDFRLLTTNAAQMALIECETKRYGLFLEKIDRWKIPIPEKGEMGIWYYDTEAMIKVKKPTTEPRYKALP